MALMHHNKLRVNALAPESDEVLDIWREQGWASGKHKDTDPEDLTEIPRVLPEEDVEPEPELTTKATKAETKKG